MSAEMNLRLANLEREAVEFRGKFDSYMRDIAEADRKVHSARARNLTEKHIGQLERRAQGCRNLAEKARNECQQALNRVHQYRNVVAMASVVPQSTSATQQYTARDLHARDVAEPNAAATAATETKIESDDEMEILGDSGGLQEGDFKCPCTLTPFTDPCANEWCSHHINYDSLKQLLARADKPKNRPMPKPGERPVPPLGSFHCPVYGCSKLWSQKSFRKDAEYLIKVKEFFDNKEKNIHDDDINKKNKERDTMKKTLHDLLTLFSKDVA